MSYFVTQKQVNARQKGVQSMKATHCYCLSVFPYPEVTRGILPPFILMHTFRYVCVPELFPSNWYTSITELLCLEV